MAQVPYAEVSDIAKEFKSISFTQSSAITSSQVESFIDQADAEINARIGGKYSVPITESDSPNSYLVLKIISTWLTVARIVDIAQVKNIQAEQAQQDVRGGNLRKMALSMLDDIVAGKMKLTDADFAVTGGGWKSFAVDTGLEHKFQKDVDQW